MPDRTIASRLRRMGVCIALLAAVAGASAQGAGAATFHPLNATDLFNDVTTANSTPGFNVIDLCDCLYLPSNTQSMVITGNVEITGPPQLQPNQFNPPGQEPQVNAQNQVAAVQPLFTISSGANVIFKAFDLKSGGGVGFPTVQVSGGNLEVDNMALAANIGDAIDISSATTNNVTINNSTVTASDNGLNGAGAGINNLAGSSNLTLNDTSIINNHAIGVEGTFVSHNTLFAGNNPSCTGAGAVNDVNSEDDDLTCNVTFGGGAPTLGPVQFNGGPTLSAVPNSGSDNIGKGSVPWCERSDQRFFTASAIPPTSCDIGAIQTGDTLRADTAGPTCVVTATNNTQGSPNQTQQVSATDNGIAGNGGDTISNWQIVLKSNMSTSNGTVTFPTVPSTLFDNSTGGTSPPPILDSPSSTAFPVTANKTPTDTTAHDTFWSFDATDWFGNTTHCQ